MRSRIFVSISMTLAALAASGDAGAQSFPSGAGWTALMRGTSELVDATGDQSPSWMDVIGSAGSPAVQIGNDGTYLFFRIRINGDPTNGSGWRSNTAWGCVIDADGVGTTYEWLAVLDAGGGLVRFRPNTSTTVADSPQETCDATNTWTGAVATYAANTQSAPYFVDFAIPWASFPQGPSVRFACGAATPTAIGADPVAGSTANTSATLTGMWTTPYVCTATQGCLLDSDGDSVADVDEVTLGTDPTKADSDGDGLPDNVELTVTGATGAQRYAFSAIDTDGDGTIDARDTDSDNDCKLDQAEGSPAWRNGSVPNANASLNCANPTPICATTSGTCVACGGDLGGGGAACYAASAPACQTTGARAGWCTQCKPSLTTLCTSATSPACEATTGTCAKCNGDNGSASTAVCPDTASPACQIAGALFGRCTVCSETNTSLCQPSAPACDPASGSCALCDGDHNAGTSKGCPTTSSPYCVLAGAGAGTCGLCTSDAQCRDGSGHAGPTCDLATGACTDTDTDGDGLNDSVELNLGTDPKKQDSDGDGIGDMTEVTYILGGAPTKIDTDGDGVIDALDLDSDGDGVKDSAEGTDDLDADTIPNFRDLDDDGDMIPTATEIDLAAKAKVSDDVDQDGKKNYYDTDADGDGKGDLFEGTGDDDDDGIPNFLDPDDKTPKRFDAGTPIAPGPTSPNESDAGSSNPGTPGAAPDDGVVEGNGFACHAGRGGSSSVTLCGLAAGALALARRRRRRRR
jgi:hypothetical protein